MNSCTPVGCASFKISESDVGCTDKMTVPYQKEDDRGKGDVLIVSKSSGVCLARDEIYILIQLLLQHIL